MQLYALRVFELIAANLFMVQANGWERAPVQAGLGSRR